MPVPNTNTSPIPVHNETVNWMQVKNCASQQIYVLESRAVTTHKFNLKLNLDYFNLNI